MAYNQNFYNNFYNGNFTFQNQNPNNLWVPPPCPVRPLSFPQLSDQEVIKQIEAKVELTKYPKPNKEKINICQLREKLTTLTSNLHKIQDEHRELSMNSDSYSEEEWQAKMHAITLKKSVIDDLIAQFNSSYLELAKKYLAKRTAKRLRLKRVKQDRKIQKVERKRENEERSRKIDENLQKIKDNILKAKQEEEAKLEADIVLKDVRSKKVDAKKFIAKLDALLKLRQARYNTAKGRGENVSENEANLFLKNIEKLKTLWTQRLDMYEKEEIQLRNKLEKNVDESLVGEDLVKIDNNLKCWKDVLFGGEMPQVDFNGDIDKFIAVRSWWDRYIDFEGSALPIGWVINTKQS